MSGTKHDSGKPMVTLVRPAFILGVAEAMTHGAKKYGKYNYREGLEYSRLLDAAFRHLLSIVDGVDVDEDSGLPNTVLVGSNMNMLLDLMQNGLGTDDRIVNFQADSELGAQISLNRKILYQHTDLTARTIEMLTHRELEELVDLVMQTRNLHGE